MKREDIKTKDQLDLFAGMEEVYAKKKLLNIALIVWILLMVYLIYLSFKCGFQANTIILGSVQTVFTVVMPIIFRHYFPKKTI